MIALLGPILAALCGGEPRASWTLVPARAQIGEPVECRLEIRAPAGCAVLLPDEDPPLAPVWVLLEPRRVERSQSAGELALVLRWKLFALEPGTRAPFALQIPVETPAGRVVLEPAGGELSVLAELAEGEDAPRAQKGFLGLADEPPPRRWIGWAALGLALAAAAAGALVLRRRKPAPIARPGPLERLALLEQEFAAEEQRGRDTVFALTHLVRERTDAWLKSPRAALPDEEWLRLVAADPRLPEAARAAAGRLLEKASVVKYAEVRPSRFLVAELCADARAALQAEELAA